jgi:hypothetical protein
MGNPEQFHHEKVEIFRVEEVTGFKPNQLVEHSLSKSRGRVRGFYNDNGKILLAVEISGMTEYVSDIPGKWNKLKDD